MASVYPKSFTVNSFILQEDGRYMATILASSHGLGTNYHVVKMIRRDSDMNWQNMIATYRILSNDSGFITSSAIPTVPTKTSQLTNDSGYITSSAIANKVDKEAGKGLSTEDYTSAEKTKLAGLSAPTKVTFTTNSWTNGTFTTAANNKVPSVVMRKNGSNYGIALVDVQLVGTNVVITSDEAFEGYVILV